MPASSSSTDELSVRWRALPSSHVTIMDDVVRHIQPLPDDLVRAVPARDVPSRLPSRLHARASASASASTPATYVHRRAVPSGWMPNFLPSWWLRHPDHGEPGVDLCLPWTRLRYCSLHGT